MKNFFLSLVLILGTVSVFSQSVGISNTAITPDASSIFEVRATNKGVLITRVALTGALDVTTIASPATSLLVYNTATAGVAPNDVSPGYYYWNGSQWVKFFTGPASDDWTLLGNTGTNPGTNFIGTTDAQDFVIRTNNAERMRVLSSGYVGINTAGPTQALHVAGNSLVSTNMYVNSTSGGVIHYGNTGLFGQTTTFNPDGANNGVWLEGSNGEGGGFFANGNCAVIWSPGDNDILRVYDEDVLPAGAPDFVIDGAGDVGIQVDPVNNCAALEVGTTNKGVLIPRVALTATNSNLPIGGGVVASLLVYNTAIAGTAPNDVIPGYYYWDGSQWVRIQAGYGEDWHILGNAGTDPTTNFLGTTDAQDMVFRTSNIEAARIQSDGTVSIGTTLDNASNLYNRIEATDGSVAYNMYNYHDGAYTGSTYTQLNYNYSSTNSTKYGIYNYINSEGTGSRYGIYNTVYQNSASNSSAYGMRNYLSSYGTSTNYGIYNYHYTNGTGTHYGLYNYMYLNGSTAGSPAYASYNLMNVGSSTNTSTIYGEYTSVDYSSGVKYGEYKIMNTSSSYSGTAYADYSSIGGSGNDAAYGYYSNLNLTGTGNHYGLYVNVAGTSNAYSIVTNNGNAIFNEIGGDYDFRVESDTRTHAMWVNADEDLVRFGTNLTTTDYQNGTSVGGTIVDYVIDCANDSWDGTAVGIGSMEYLLDQSAETMINNRFSPTVDNTYSLGSLTRRWSAVYAANGTIQTSDSTLKKNIEAIEYGLDEVLQLRPVSFDWIDADPDQKTKLGFLAQDLLKVIPEVVKTHDMVCVSEEPLKFEVQKAEYMGVFYSDIIPVLVKAMQEEDAKVEELEQKVEDQEEYIENLEERISALEELLIQSE